MKKFRVRDALWACGFFGSVLVWAATSISSVVMSNSRIVNSTVDNTTVGATTPSSGSFTSVVSNSYFGNYIQANGGTLPGSYGNTGTLTYGHEGVGDTDFIAANGGSSPVFDWYYLLGSTLTKEMWLNASAQLNVPNGINANLTGNVTGSLTGNASTATNVAYSGLTGGVPTWNQSTTGNAATATHLASTPTTCGATSGTYAYGINTSGNALCTGPVYGYTTSVTNTGSGGLSVANTNVPLLQNGSAFTMPDTNYIVSCNIINQTGFPMIFGLTKFTTYVQVSYTNGDSSEGITSGGAEIDCVVFGT